MALAHLKLFTVNTVNNSIDSMFLGSELASGGQIRCSPGKGLAVVVFDFPALHLIHQIKAWATKSDQLLSFSWLLVA